MTATIYQLFRSIISDEATPYTVSDTYSLTLLDKAIDVASAVTDYTFDQTYSITQTDINNGYFELDREIVSLLRPLWTNRGITWEYGGGKKIRIIDDNFGVQNNVQFKYRARYVKFEGVVKDQSAMDLPIELNYPVVLYALALYMNGKAISNVDNELGIIKSKMEENMKVEYGLGTETLADLTPDKLKMQATKMMRNVPMENNMFISIKL